MRRMEKAPIVICSVVGFLGLLAAALAIAAEATRLKASQTVPTSSGCIYPSSPASGLGLAAALALTVAQIIISISTGCLCCRRQSYQSNSSKRLAIIFFVISWITFVHAFLILLAAAAVNANPGYSYSDTNPCQFVGRGVFAGAAVLSIGTVVLGIAYYLAWDSAKMGNNSWNGTAAAPNQGGIAMGLPQFPPPSQYPQQQYPPPPQQYPPQQQYPPPQYPQQYPPQQQYPPPQYPPKNAEGPVFVHEDTYMRRQFT